MTRRIVFVDVFAERRYAGNPLAVVLDDALPQDETQRIAAEIDFSETTFVAPRPQADGAWRTRIFTPAREIAFAGHPILGTAAVLRELAGGTRPATLRLALQVGVVAVDFASDAAGAEVAWFTAPAVTAGPTCAPSDIAPAVGLAASDIDDATPVQQMSASTSAMIVPLRSRAALERCRLDLAAYAALAARGFSPLVYLWCREPHDARNDLCVRFFFEAYGVREDPATGNGAAFLGAYLLEHRAFASAFSLRIEQGHALQRPSLVLLRGDNLEGRPRIRVGGTVITTLRGELV